MHSQVSFLPDYFSSCLCLQLRCELHPFGFLPERSLHHSVVMEIMAWSEVLLEALQICQFILLESVTVLIFMFLGERLLWKWNSGRFTFTTSIHLHQCSKGINTYFYFLTLLLHEQKRGSYVPWNEVLIFQSRINRLPHFKEEKRCSNWSGTC